MEKRSDSPYPRLDRPVLAAIGVLLVVSTLLFLRNDREHEWRWYQAEFRNLVAQKYGEEMAKTVPAGMRQIWAPALGRGCEIGGVCLHSRSVVSCAPHDLAAGPPRAAGGGL